jgi:AraC-like DNA-binding protein
MRQKHDSITFGEELKKLKVGGFVLTQTYHPPRLILPRHDHECANINFTINGSFKEIFGSQPQEATDLSILIKPAGEHHANRYGEAGAHGFIIEVLPHKLETLRRFTKLFDATAHIRGGLLPAFLKRIHKEFWTMNGAAAELMIEGLILEMLAEAARREIKVSSSEIPPVWLQKARDFIHATFAERTGLSEVAAAADINPTYLARMFRKFYGCSIGEYARRLQLEFAARELTESSRTLAEISAAAGFYDQSHFSNAFKLYFKITPAGFRATNKRVSYKKS